MEFKRLFHIKSHSIVVICLASIFLVLFSTMSESASVTHHQKRSAVITQQSSNDIYEECSDGAPCGWEVYNPHSRAFQYYVQSSCKCNAKINESCVQLRDDITIAAYVYKCRVIPKKHRLRNSQSPTRRSSSTDSSS